MSAPHPNPLVAQRVANLLWRAIEAERQHARIARGRAERAPDAAGLREHSMHEAIAEQCVAELERVHAAYCAGVVVAVVPPLSDGSES